MLDLDQALLDLTTIRRQVVATAVFRGFGPLTAGATALLAVVAAVLQHRLLPTSGANPTRFVLLWVSTAVLAAGLLGAEALVRTRRARSSLATERLRLVLEQFFPSLAAGALLTVTLVRFAPSSLSMLPGLWQILSALGILASARSLPEPIRLVGMWYLFCGLSCLALPVPFAFSPLAMGLPYVFGQSLMATILLTSQRKEGHDL